MNLCVEICKRYCEVNPIVATKKYGIYKDRWQPLGKPFDKDRELENKLLKLNSSDPYLRSLLTFVKNENNKLNTPLSDYAFNHIYNPFQRIFDLNIEGQTCIARINAMLNDLPRLKSSALNAASYGYSLSKRECEILIDSLINIPKFIPRFDTEKEIFINWIKYIYYPVCKDAFGIFEIPNYKLIYSQIVKGFCSLDITPDQVFDEGIKGVKSLYEIQNQLLKSAGFSREYFIKEIFKNKNNRFSSSKECVNTAFDLFNKLKIKTKQKFRKPENYIDAEFVPVVRESRTLGWGSEYPFIFYFNEARWDGITKSDMFPFILHESYPGHAFMFQYMNNNKPDCTKIVFLNNVVESIAVFAERLFSDEDTILDQISRLNYKLWRAIRCVIDVGIHYYGFSEDKCKQLMEMYCIFEEGVIESEFKRYCANPGQACSYYIGLTQLENECMNWEKRGKTIYEFYQAILDNCMFDMNTLLRKIKLYY
jgi:hypothetical protein